MDSGRKATRLSYKSFLNGKMFPQFCGNDLESCGGVEKKAHLICSPFRMSRVRLEMYTIYVCLYACPQKTSAC